MKRLLLFLMFSAVALQANAQYTLDGCQEMAREHYPLIRQYGIVEKMEEFSISNASRAWIPQLSLSGSATWQSDIVSFPDDMLDMFRTMGLDFEGLHKDQYKFSLNLEQTIWDGGVSRTQKEVAKAEKEVALQNMETELHALKERVTQVYFGILTLDGQLNQIAVVEEILKDNLKVVESMMQGETATKSDADKLKVEIMTNSQQKAKVEGMKKAYVGMLSLMTGERMDESSVFEKPQEVLVPAVGGENFRPELRLLDAKATEIDVRRKSLNNAVMPRFSLFAQGYYGYPGLNMFEDMVSYRWSPYLIAGIRFQWNISAFYTKRNSMRKLDLSRQQIDIQKETFLYNSRIEQTRLSMEIDRMAEIMRTDEEIIELRSGIRQASEIRLRNGTITVNELLKDISSETSAEIDRNLHELEYLKNIYELKNAVNN